MYRAKADIDHLIRSQLRGVFFLLLFILGVSIGKIRGQDIGQAINDFHDRLTNQPVTISGSLSGSAQLNAISGMLRRRDPFNFNLFGQLNFDILGVQAPLSLAIADGNTTFNLPSYTFVGISPSYKWVKLHLFRRNMQFSDYTLSGHGFNGAGFDISPGKFRVMGMLGTLRKARLEDYGFRQELDPFYRRQGFALRFGFDDGGDHIYATVFKASDDELSLNLPDSLSITPQENLVISAEGKKKLSEVLTMEGEYAFSVLTPDKRFSDRRALGLEKLTAPFIQLNTASKSSSAYNFAIDFSPVQTWAVSLKYERINPNFVSLGTLQFRNDFENVSLGYRGKLSNKIALAGRIGLERNNLDDQEIENRNRFIGSLQLNVPLSERWQNGFSYSNFRQTTRLIDNSNTFEPVDSIFLGSVNNQFGLNSNYKINNSQRLLVNFSHQRANSIVKDQITQATSKVNNVSINYHYGPKDSKLNGGLTLLWNGLQQADIETSVISPVLQINYLPGEKITTTLTMTNSLTRINGIGNGHIFRLALRNQYSISKIQRLNIQVQYLNRAGAVANNFREFNGRVGYSMSF